ncbi:MAG: recombinase family protein [Oscillospiraceae bacterium]
MEKIKFGYARVSTDAQSLDRQIDALNKYGVDELLTEKMTGTKRSRPELDRLIDKMRAGDTVVIESLSRLGRSTKDLLALVEQFNEQGVILVSLKENIDISTPTGKLLVTVLSALCQFERDLTVQRTNEGLTAARARGRKGGRPPADKKAIEKALKLYDAKAMSISEICEVCGISQGTLYKAKNERNNEKENENE